MLPRLKIYSIYTNTVKWNYHLTCFWSRMSTFKTVLLPCIQFPNMNTDRLLNKPYWNGLSLTEQNLSLKCCQSLEQTLFSTMRSRSFQWGTVGLCRSKVCKVTSCQSWRSRKKVSRLAPALIEPLGQSLTCSWSKSFSKFDRW